ncbi:MAG: hypothetical protein NC222_07025 [Staphylococcus sp.]|nr:hypothetical protein [Staphylococcus sp.]
MRESQMLMIEEDSCKLYLKALTMKKIYGYIYLTLKNTVPVYVGQSTVLTYKHTTKYNGSGVIIRKSLCKNEKHNFFSIILDLAETKDELNNLETYYIKKYNTLLPKFGGAGYNISSGGNGIGTYKRGQENPASSKNMSREKRVAKGKKGAETRKTLKTIGKFVPRKLTDEERINLSIKAKERWGYWKKTGRYNEIISKSKFIKDKNFCKANQPKATKKAKELALKLGNPNAKVYTLIDPRNKVYLVKGKLLEFCKNHQLSLPRLRRFLNKGIIPEPRKQNYTIRSMNTSGWSISGGDYLRKDCKRREK